MDTQIPHCHQMIASHSGIKSVVRRTEEHDPALQNPTTRVDLSFSRFVQLLFGEFLPSDLKSSAQPQEQQIQIKPFKAAPIQTGSSGIPK
jgi:hypothetical protein